MAAIFRVASSPPSVLFHCSSRAFLLNGRAVGVAELLETVAGIPLLGVQAVLRPDR